MGASMRPIILSALVAVAVLAAGSAAGHHRRDGTIIIVPPTHAPGPLPRVFHPPVGLRHPLPPFIPAPRSKVLVVPPGSDIIVVPPAIRRPGFSFGLSAPNFSLFLGDRRPFRPHALRPGLGARSHFGLRFRGGWLR